MAEITKIEIPDELIEQGVNEALSELQGVPLEEDLIEVDLTPEDLQGLEGELSGEELGAIRQAFPFFGRLLRRRLRRLPRFRRGMKRGLHRAVSKILPAAVKKGVVKPGGEFVFWYHGKQPANNTDLEYFSSKAAGDRYNFAKDGIIPDTDTLLTGITAFITPVNTSKDDVTNIISKMLTADIKLYIGSDKKLEVPLEMIIDFNPAVAISTDGNAAATTVDIVFLKNSRLERGILPLSGIVLPKGKTAKIEVNFRQSFTNSTYWLFFGLAGKEA